MVGGETFAPLTPFVASGTGSVDISGWRLGLSSADRAVELGLSPVATNIYRRLLASPELPLAERNGVILSLVSSLLEQSLVGEAQEALKLYVGLPNSRWQLRTALIAGQQKRYDAVRAILPTIKGEELVAAERGWYFFLQGVTADAANDGNRANQFYTQAFDAAVSEQERARFEIARYQSKLQFGQVTEQGLNEQRGNVERFQGTRAGHTFVSTYATSLYQLNHKPEAIAVLQKQLRTLSVDEKSVADDYRLLIGFISGSDTPSGRSALNQLLDNAVSKDTQRVALQLLARGSQTVNREAFIKKLSDLIGSSTQHPILEDLLIVRAQLMLTGKASTLDLAQAEADATDLLQRFPGSPLKADALGILVSVMWEEKRYRSATDFIARLRSTIPAGPERSDLGVLLAEAYASVVREHPEGISTGDLLYQRIVSQIRDDRVDDTAILIDDLVAKEPGFDATNRWRAEWNLAQAFQARGSEGTTTAYQRVTRVIGDWVNKSTELPPALSPDLFFKLEWLQARLAFDSGDAASAQILADKLLSRLAGPTANGLPPTLRFSLESTSLLIKAQSFLAHDDMDKATQLITKLRADFPQSEAAVYSLFVQADYYTSKNRIVDAQQLLQQVADEDKEHKNPYAAYALYAAARNAERRGSNQYYQEAYNLLERIWTDYHSSDLVFYSRLHQGDLLRLMNNFSNAQVLYNELEAAFKTHPDLLLAEMATAACHFAQSSDPTHFESAVVVYERIRDLPAAPLDMRVEAGFMYGYAYAKRIELDKAQTAFWSVVDGFLRDERVASRLGSTGRYWMTRCLLDLGGVLEQQGKNDYAREAYQMIIKANLSGQALAKERSISFSSAEARP